MCVWGLPNETETTSSSPMHNKPVYLKTTHSVLCLAHEATRQAHSHVTGTRRELSKQIIAFLHKLQSQCTRDYLYKRKMCPCSPRRQKIFTCSSVQFFQVSMALSVWQRVCKAAETAFHKRRESDS